MAFLAGGLLDFLSKILEISEGSGDRTTDSNEAISNKIGTPADTDVSTDIANVQTAVDGITVIPSEASTTTTGTIISDSAAGVGTPEVQSVTSSATANTFGSWVTMDASASADIQIAIITVAAGNTGAAHDIVIEIGTGAGPTTKMRIPFHMDYSTSAGYTNPIVFTLPIPIKVASGVSISARISDGSASAKPYKVSLAYYTGLE